MQFSYLESDGIKRALWVNYMQICLLTAKSLIVSATKSVVAELGEAQGID
jgi:hypothetical protein